MSKEKVEFIPGKETEEQFDQVLELLSEWIKAGVVEVEIDDDADIGFKLPDEMEELLGTQTPKDLTQGNVEAIIATEMPAIISAGLNKNKRSALKRRIPEELHENVELLLNRSEKTIKILLGKEIKERIFLRKKTSSYIVSRIQWKEGSYHLPDIDSEEKIDVPFISMDIGFSKPSSGVMLSFMPTERILRGKRQDDINIGLDLHKDDLKDLIKKLSDILGELDKRS